MSVDLNSLEELQDVLDIHPLTDKYYARHGIESASILTVYDDERAALLAERLRDRIQGKIVVEIGAGLGLLACHMAEHAKRVFAIEANPAWTHAYLMFLYHKKPKNVSFLFGSADEFRGDIRADVAIFCTHSDQAGMRTAGLLFSPEVIDVYGEIYTPEMLDVLGQAIPFRGRRARPV